MDKPDPAQNLMNEFPILEHGLYANHAAIAPWPLATTRAVTDFARENCELGPQKYARWLLKETQLRSMLADMINADSRYDIALLKNTTDGICTVANGIDWRSGDNLVLPADEFPSNRLPWLALQHLGVEVREVEISNVADPEQSLLNHMDERTRLLSVSAIRWADGLRLRLDVLGQACRNKDVLFFVDAIQQLGAMQIDVQACCIDMLAADGHKWLLSAEGIAVFYCREAIRDQLALSQHGWRMVDEPYRFSRDEWLPSPSASRFEAGSPNMLGQIALHASVGLLLDIGMHKVEAGIESNSSELGSGLSEIPGIELVRPLDMQRISGIVSFRIPDRDLIEVFNSLQKRNLTCALRGNAIRLSPHFYQAGECIQEMLNVIEDV